MLVAQNILTAQKHLELGVGHCSADLAQSFPRVLIEEAQAHIEGGTAPALGRVVTGLVKLGEDRFKLLIGKSCCDQRLVRISKDSFCKLNFLHAHPSSVNVK